MRKLGFRCEVLGVSNVGINYGKVVGKKHYYVHKMCTFLTRYNLCKYRLNTQKFYTFSTHDLHTAIHTWTNYFSAWIQCRVSFIHTIPNTNNNNHFFKKNLIYKGPTT